MLERISIWAPSFVRSHGGIQALSADVLEACQSFFPTHGIQLLGDGENLSPLLKLRFAFRCFMDLIVRRPRAVVLMHSNFYPLVQILQKLFRIKIVVWLHGIEVWSMPKSLRNQSTLSLFVCISSVTYEKTSAWRDSSVPCLIIHPTADFERFTPDGETSYLLSRHGIPDTAEVILTVGRLDAEEAYKGHDSVIRAMPFVLKSRPNAWYLVVGTGNDQQRLEQLAIELGVSDRVLFTGFVRGVELVDYYRSAVVFAMPSCGEGFGIVYLEALGCGCQVIGGVEGGAGDALGHGQFGELVDSQDVDSLAMAIIHALSAGRNLNARSEVIEHFGKERFVKDIARMLEAVKD
jgi:glycosyltransferase involved in cell wall biosynthesis